MPSQRNKRFIFSTRFQGCGPGRSQCERPTCRTASQQVNLASLWILVMTLVAALVRTVEGRGRCAPAPGAAVGGGIVPHGRMSWRFSIRGARAQRIMRAAPQRSGRAAWPYAHSRTTAVSGWDLELPEDFGCITLGQPTISPGTDASTPPS